MSGSDQKIDPSIIWDQRFLELAHLISKWSKDPSTKVGAVIVDPLRRIVSTGYNGLPKSIPDKVEYYNDREVKYKIIVHADMNAIMFAPREIAGCTMYTWPATPCSVCASAMIQKGIYRVVSPGWLPEPRWAESNALTARLFHEANVLLDIVQTTNVPIWNITEQR